MWGIIDSGFGGLSLVKELQLQGKKLNFVYFGDNKYNPYGVKEEKEILNRIKKILYYLNKKYSIYKFIIACNTASIVYLKHKDSLKDFLVIPISQYTVSYINKNKIEDITTLATKYTINSKYYQDNLNVKKMTSIDAQYFVKLVEQNNFNLDLNDRNIYKITKNIKSKNIIIGCTHFYFLKPSLSKILKNAVFIDPSVLLVKEIFENNKVDQHINDIILTTGDKEYFCNFMIKTKIQISNTNIIKQAKL